MIAIPFALMMPYIKDVVGKITGFFKSLTLKQVLIFAGVCLIAFALKSFYDWSFERGSDSRQAEIDLLLDENETMRRQFKEWTEETDRANQQYIEKSDQIIAKLTKERDDANARADKRKIEYRDVIKYITVEDDANCVIPVNFGLMHNRAIEGTNSWSNHQLSETAAGLQGTASTLTLSEYAAIASENNSEAVRRGSVILQWEAWYDEHKAIFEQAQKQADAHKVQPAPNKAK